MNLTLPTVDPSEFRNSISPAVVFFPDRIQQNIDHMIRMVGSADRLRPHCKTHKSADVTKMLLHSGVSKFKAATVAEAEMLFQAGAKDVVLAYPIVGPNIDRCVRLVKQFVGVRFCVTADQTVPVIDLAKAMAAEQMEIDILVDLNVGQNRTGIPIGSDQVRTLCRTVSELPGIRLRGFQIYDGHLRQPDFHHRRLAARSVWPAVMQHQSELAADGISISELLCGGTPTFPVYAEMTDPAIVCSPGTSVLHDAGYGQSFEDLPFVPAAGVMTRIISLPGPDLITLDLGSKAVAPDPPMGHRVYFPDLPDARQVGHNEEHLVLQTDQAGRFRPGDVLLGIPVHICPTTALHEASLVIRDGRVVDQWTVTARNRRLTI